MLASRESAALAQVLIRQTVTKQGIGRHQLTIHADAYATHPERFVRKPPEPPQLPTSSWINPPDPEEATQ